MPPSNELLAEVYRKDIPQVVVVWPLIWKHNSYNDWQLYGHWESELFILNGGYDET